jgi:endonuclease/exonuclease/phosphatase family metal-dependent hydrolase
LESYSGAQRAAQVARLLELNAEALAHSAARASTRYADGPFQPWPRPAAGILCGDFNMQPGDATLSRLLDPYVDAWQCAHPGRPHAPTFRVHDAAEEPYCCDYVFVTPDLAPRIASVRVGAETLASDHQPVIVEFEK